MHIPNTKKKTLPIFLTLTSQISHMSHCQNSYCITLVLLYSGYYEMIELSLLKNLNPIYRCAVKEKNTKIF